MLKNKLEKLRTTLQTREQVKAFDAVCKEVNRMDKISHKYAEAFAHCWDGMDAAKAAEEAGLTKKGAWGR